MGRESRLLQVISALLFVRVQWDWQETYRWMPRVNKRQAVRPVAGVSRRCSTLLQL